MIYVTPLHKLQQPATHTNTPADRLTRLHANQKNQSWLETQTSSNWRSRKLSMHHVDTHTLFVLALLHMLLILNHSFTEPPYPTSSPIQACGLRIEVITTVAAWEHIRSLPKLCRFNVTWEPPLPSPRLRPESLPVDFPQTFPRLPDLLCRIALHLFQVVVLKFYKAYKDSLSITYRLRVITLCGGSSLLNRPELAHHYLLQFHSTR